MPTVMVCKGSKVQNWAREKGGEPSLIWGAKHKCDIGGGGQRPIMGGLGGWGLGVMAHKSLKSEV